jgi:energy-coupling factor transport system substrate-specific component
MNEILSPFFFQHQRKQILICALIFIGMAVPFKVMVLIEGLTEVRPVNALPVVAGLLLGPAGAWGCAFGNLIADCFGTLSWASVLGFAGNFVAAYLPYKLWHLAGKRETPNAKTFGNIAKYIGITAVASTATALLLACGLDVFFGNWLPQIFWIVLLNDFAFPLVLGLPVLIVLTSAESGLEITLPEDNRHRPGKKAAGRKYLLIMFLLASESFLALMIAGGLKMSASPEMLLAGTIFLVALSGIILKR